MMWPGPGSDHSSRVEVPVHDVPAAGAEPEIDRGRVHDDAVAGVDRPGELREHVRALGLGASSRASTATRCRPGSLLEHRVDASRCRNDGIAGIYRAIAMRRSTRSSRDLNGSLHSTVRCAWSLSFRCTQSTV